MRTLKFIVNAQKLEKDPSCDFSGIVSGTKGYLEAEFSVSKEWSYIKTENDSDYSEIISVMDTSTPVSAVPTNYTQSDSVTTF